MIDKETQDEILLNIEKGGSVLEFKDPNIINGNMIHILNLGSGSARLQTNVVSRFKLLLERPEILSHLHHSHIRCALCHSVISYPCWYYRKDYNVNKFHYFVCFDAASTGKPTAKCYKRS